jgi:sortase A
MRVRRSVSLLLVLSGVILLAMAALHYWRGFQAQTEGKRQWEERRAAVPPTLLPPFLTPRENPGIEGQAQIAPTAAPSYPYGQPVARLRIPSARIDTVVFGGADQASLEKGPGHLPGSELPGEDTGRGNCVITGHRDSHFRHLGWLRKGHRIELETPSGQTASYEVVSREIVTPDAVRVLAPTEKPRLTLITCYPFNYVGSAPKRLVVVAEPVLRYRS